MARRSCSSTVWPGRAEGGTRPWRRRPSGSGSTSSMGGRIAAEVAADAPARVSRLVLGDAAIFLSRDRHPRARGVVRAIRRVSPALVPLEAAGAFRAGPHTLLEASLALLTTGVAAKRPGSWRRRSSSGTSTTRSCRRRSVAGSPRSCRGRGASSCRARTTRPWGVSQTPSPPPWLHSLPTPPRTAPAETHPGPTPTPTPCATARPHTRLAPAPCGPRRKRGPRVRRRSSRSSPPQPGAMAWSWHRCCTAWTAGRTRPAP